ncbi:4Fe-4S dicluster domain-containing protein [Candidatus Bipolaricaulota bacterium]|jgi:formate dehydrogenase subunit beta|nr:4Fe-4S dicluster domain-containing protein [Candidatus Bipolaricaulota bacterium]MCK4681508.1 4Fe-4S dicluster domain-containing protein [Candidatus Bipolaricaulota bacterium]
MNKGHLLPAQKGVSQAVAGLLKRCLEEKIFDAVLVPLDSHGNYNYVLLDNGELLDKAAIMPPVMSVQGGKAVQSLTRHGNSKKIAVVMRLCEIRAAVELSKLRQTDLENVFFISVDCPGVMPLSDYLERASHESKNTELMLRPLCQVCDNFSLAGNDKVTVVDLHVGTMGLTNSNVLLIPGSAIGEEVLRKLGMDPKPMEEIEHWSTKVGAIQDERRKARKEALADIREKVSGLEGLLEVFSRCIECHNCQSVCPICYCRLCFADKDTSADTPNDYLQRADSTGAVRHLPEPLLFHLGRIAHMSLSCVSCGMCEDVCPVSIPVGQVVSFVSEETRSIFDYVPGRNPEETLPLARYELEELTEVEDV